MNITFFLLIGRQRSIGILFYFFAHRSSPIAN